MNTLLESYSRLVWKAFFSVSEGRQGVNQRQGSRGKFSQKPGGFGINLALYTGGTECIQFFLTPFLWYASIRSNLIDLNWWKADQITGKGPPQGETVR